MEQFPDQNNTPSDDRGQKNRTVPILIAGFIVLALGFTSGWLLGTQKPVDPFQSTVPPVTSQGTNGNEVPVNWSKLTMIKDQIYQIYDGPIDESEMVEGAIKGMVDSLGDPYSQFYNAQEYREYKSGNSGKFVGVGIQINVQNDEIVVVAPIDGSPAKEAGIMSGDVIIRVDGKVYTGKDMNEAVDYMRGQEGDPVTLTIRRNDEEIDFEIIRREITTKSVRYEMLADDIGLITVSQFTEKVDEDFKNALDELSADGAKGFILDLRGNPGGYLPESVRLASNFIPENRVVVSTVDKHGNREEDLSKGGDYIGTPLVVLVDMGSASASEVVAGALKDYDAATLVGQKTFGKGIVQTILDLDDGEGLKLTVASYYSPKGTNIHQIGIKPDIPIAYPDNIPAVDYSQETDTQLQKAIEVLQEKIEQAD